VRPEKAGSTSPVFPEEDRKAMVIRPPMIRDIVSGIILLAARGMKPIPLATVHSIIHAMKPHEPILSGLRFSLTGAVCYSRDIDQAVERLADAGFLKVVEGAVFVGENVDGFAKYLSGFLTNSQVQAVHSASLRFHDRVRREARDPGHRT
jgi:hypothetical protein